MARSDRRPFTSTPRIVSPRPIALETIVSAVATTEHEIYVGLVSNTTRGDQD